MRKTKILLVDDEPETLRYVGASLQSRGYDVATVGDGSEALKRADEDIFDLVVLDISMPGPDGFAVCEALRQRSDVPIIMLSARGREADKVRSLDLGADDYLTKPFGVQELLARIRSVLRRSERGSGRREPLWVGELMIDFGQRRVTRGGEEIRLTRTEYDLLAQLARVGGKVLTHATLLQRIWGPEYRDENEYLWVYVRRLRQKLEPDPENPRYILTEAGVGYRFASP